ncbi:MAG: methyltransferase domain-containing protein [Nitriliruptorales bacterium]|nr:methyltransferase domain-containing protein [Nitriliruptorales bacterium]
MAIPPEDRRSDVADGHPATFDDPAPSYTGAANLEAMEEARNYNALLTSIVYTHADRARPVLDFGAGNGTHAKHLRHMGLDVHCVEPDAALRAGLKDSGFDAVATVDALGPGRFGTTYSFNVLEHIEEDLSAVRALTAALSHGGRMILYVPAFQVLFSEMDRAVGHYRRYRRDQLTGMVETAGLEVMAAEYVDSLGFLAALMYRLIRGSGDLDPRAVGFYDRAVFPVSRLIDRFTARTVGKNLLVVGRRD